MNKIYLVIICLFVLVNLPNTSNAQLKFGLKAGLSSSSIKMKDIVAETQKEDVDYQKLKMMAGDAKVGFHFGAVARAEIFSFYLQPELLFSSVGGQVKVTDLTDSEHPLEKVKDQRFSKVDIPIMLGKTLGPLHFCLGPVASFTLKDGSGLKNAIKELAKSDQTKEEVKEEFKKASWGYQVGVGLDVWKLTLDLKFEGNFSKLGDEVTVLGDSYSTDTRTRQLIVSLGYFF